MAQSLYHKKDGTQTAVETEGARFLQLISDSQIGALTRIAEGTKDSWQLDQLSMCKFPSVRSSAVMNECISRDVLKKRIEFGDISVSFSGLQNPIIFRRENTKFFQSTIESVLVQKDSLLLQALLKNPDATSDWLERIFHEEVGEYSLGRKDRDVIKLILLHPNTPPIIKIKYASSEGTNFEDEMFRNAAKQSLRESHTESLR